MRVSVRLSGETMQAIDRLKEYFQQELTLNGLRLTNGAIVNNVFQQIKDPIDWDKIIKSQPIYFGTPSDIKDEVKTNLTLNADTISKIEQYKKIFPKYTGTSYVTIPYVIRIVLRAYIIQNDIK